mmetsp:Transcript_6342/g.20257  ORF Transcript_6342/g.20257 Transcript_6342/m.20257 type:complete len:207 (+) Transcript_6342:278-898(+)
MRITSGIHLRVGWLRWLRLSPSPAIQPMHREHSVTVRRHVDGRRVAVAEPACLVERRDLVPVRRHVNGSSVVVPSRSEKQAASLLVWRVLPIRLDVCDRRRLGLALEHAALVQLVHSECLVTIRRHVDGRGVAVADAACLMDRREVVIVGSHGHGGDGVVARSRKHEAAALLVGREGDLIVRERGWDRGSDCTSNQQEHRKQLHLT